MARFPADPFVLFSDRARVKIDALAASTGDIRRERLVWVPDVMSNEHVVACLRLLERHIEPLLKPVRVPIPMDAIRKMRRNYADAMPKTACNHSAILNSRRTRAARVADGIGLLGMMRSEGMRKLGEMLTGFRLEPDPGCQVICYRAGDHVGPHNDHHPEAFNLRNGYVDLHLGLSNSEVDHQWLVYETCGFLSNMVQVGVQSGISGSFLPFWHYTTPLAARDGAIAEAKRWLLLTSFSIVTDDDGEFVRIR